MIEENKTACYLNESITKSGPIEYTDNDIALTEAINTSRTVAALEKQVDLYQTEIDLYKQKIEEIKKTTYITRWTAFWSLVVGIASIAATIISAIFANADIDELFLLIQSLLS